AVIKGQSVEVVSQYKYLGTVLDEELSFEANTDAVRGKALQRLYFLRKLCSFNVDMSFIKMFYSCFIESVLTFSLICWYGSLNLKNRCKLGNIVKVCSKLVGTDLTNLSQIHVTRATRKAQLVLSDSSHPLHRNFQLLPSGRRYRLPQCRTNTSTHSSRQPLALLMNHCSVLSDFCFVLFCSVYCLDYAAVVQQIASRGQ
ncbi:hypothetical protein LDENG_00163040, partial [Lucifuga dentata]